MKAEYKIQMLFKGKWRSANTPTRWSGLDRIFYTKSDAQEALEILMLMWESETIRPTTYRIVKRTISDWTPVKEV